MQSVAGVVVDVIQIKARRAAIEFLRPVQLAQTCRENAVNARGQAGFVNGHRLIEIEVAADGFPVEVEIIEV